VLYSHNCIDIERLYTTHRLVLG